ncbi:Uncharacterised protein [Legionella busanensis]|uniref:Uncharacterized protein n=1 Tax=Legionella busanensis TaxID=190655 RepID=A0A378JLL2_9GAMM|nr:hypothetical protein [Legionella busanensis]STX51193.1 Uncharacterised protein [Legionella busanensis]
MYKKLILSCLICFFILLGWASTSQNRWFTKNAQDVTLEVNLFTISTCPFCQKAQTFLSDFAKRNPWIKINHYIINKDKQSLITFHDFLQEQNIDDYSVPAIFFCNSRWVGFRSVEQSGAQLAAGLNYCHDQIIKNGELSDPAIQTLKQMSLANWYEENITSANSTSTFIFIMALLDALNPSVTLLLLTIIAFLLILPNRKTIFITLSGFILGIGIAHYFQIAHLSLFHDFIALFQIPAILIGLGLIIFTLIFLKKSAPSSSIAITFMTALLTAFAIQSYIQLNNSPNFALIVNQWLISQQLSIGKQITYQLIYTFIYVLPFILLSLLIVFLLRRTRWQQYLSPLQCLSKSLLIIIGAILAIYPYILNHLIVIFMTLVLAILITWLLPKSDVTRENF